MSKNEFQTAAKIRDKYVEKPTTELDALRELDAKVTRPANLFAYIFGSISAIIMGAGMSLVMTDIGEVVGIGDPLVPGIVIGVVGMIMAILNYPMHQGILNSRKKTYSAEILELSNSIINKR